MKPSSHKAVAIVGLGAVLPDAPNVAAFWQNLTGGKYSITDVPVERWDPALYYDPDPKAPDKSYSRIGGWVRDFDWNPLKWKLPIPPKVGDAMDLTQKWAIMAAREALLDYGFPDQNKLDGERTAVILGNAMGGDTHLYTASRILFPEYAVALSKAGHFSELPKELRENILKEFRDRVGDRFPLITEDTMPGELSNIIAGRIAALFNFRGPNYVADAACASAMAAINAAIEGLEEYDFDAVLTGGIDANMSASTYVKFSKIGALSGSGTRPYAAGADGFVMGEGAAVFLLKRLEDAEKAGDRIYAVIRGIGGSSDGKGKGITAPNPIGQKLAVQRAWHNAGIDPGKVNLIEGHGTSTAVGDMVELQCLDEVFAQYNIPRQSVALGSVKSNIGHLKGAAGAAGILKAALCLTHKTLVPSLNFNSPNPNIDFNNSPFYVNTATRAWESNGDGIRRAGVSAFGFGGTNFHTVLEAFVPGHIQHDQQTRVYMSETPPTTPAPAGALKAPLRGALVLGGDSEQAILTRLEKVHQAAGQGQAPPPAPPEEQDLRAPLRLVIDYGDAAELAQKCDKAHKALQGNNPAAWKMLRTQGIFLGKGPAPKVAFLYTGQGSQYVNMLKELQAADPLVSDTFREADDIMKPLIPRPLSSYIFINSDDSSDLKQADHALRQTEITQPAVLTVDLALTRLLAAYGMSPDMVMGHSLGEYGALVAAGALPFADALKAVSARGTEMAKVSVADNGLMAACFGPLEEIEKIINTVEGYVVIANINSNSQAVIGGATDGVKKAVEALEKAGFTARLLPVSHAFHTEIVAPASEPLGRVLSQMNIRPPALPIVANVTGEPYPMGPGVEPQMVDMLARQVAAPVQFVKGLKTLYDAGVRVFVEVGPKKALQGFVEDVLGKEYDVLALCTNHPKQGDMVSFNQALCGLYAAGLGVGQARVQPAPEVRSAGAPAAAKQVAAPQNGPTRPALPSAQSTRALPGSEQTYLELGHLFADFLEKGMQIYRGGAQPQEGGLPGTAPAPGDFNFGGSYITGAALGLPGREKIFDDDNIERILSGDQFISQIPMEIRRAMVDKHIVRIVKDKDGNGSFETIDDPADVIKLAARGKGFDLAEEFGYPQDRIPALDIVTALAIAAGIDALRDAGIPLVMRYKTTTRGTLLPDRWGLPDELRDDTGVIFASAFPGYNAYADEMKRYYEDRARRERLQELETLRAGMSQGAPAALADIDRRILALKIELEQQPYKFDRRFLFKVLAMGHAQFADYIGARGPNTQINAACASTTQAVTLANDWIQSGRCRRVVIVSADDVTSDAMLEWFGAGFLATGAAATDENVEDAAIPFDRRRHGMIVGMGGASLVVESAAAARERGILPICEVLGTITANSAFHGTRLDVAHICQVMESLVSDAERQWGINRYDIAPQMVFISHETYTPARGGSAAAEVNALRHVFGESADLVVISNTKGFTGHAMATGIEDVVAVKVLETGIVPPVANFREIDPDLGQLNLSRGGDYPVRYALRLGAGFGSQISMSLLRWVPTPDGQHLRPAELGYRYRIADPHAWKAWLKRVSGYDDPELIVEQRNLKVKDQGPVTAQAKAVPASQPVSAPAPPAPPQTAPVPQPAVAATPPPAAQGDAVQEKVMQLIAEKTGYPTEMLDLELDLEADLGIDTVKQAEMFAAVREAYNIPREENLKLRDFPTLGHVIQFVYDRRPDLQAAKTAAPQPASAPVASAAPQPSVAQSDAVQEKVMQLIAEKTGYPTEMLDLELDLEADLGIDTVKQAEMFAAVREAYNIPREENLKLRDFPTMGHVIQFVYDRRPDLQPSATATATATATPAPEMAPTPSTIPAQDEVTAAVLSLIAEKTGYPPEMLDLELDLEADLGIDTVKQAEVFAAIRALYDIPRDENLKLRDFPTLAHTIEFVYSKRPDLRPAAAPPAPAPAPEVEVPTAAPSTETAATSVPEDDGVKEAVLNLIAEKTGYPVEMLDLELDLEADLGIDTVKQAEVFAAIREIYGIPRDENLKLRDFPTLAHTIEFVYSKRPDLRPAAATPASAPEANAPAAEPAAESHPAGAPKDDGVKEAVLNLIAEKTGYPVEMLDLELDLEADLGIDTVKQAEVFAAIREIYGIPRDENLKLRDFPTLAHTIEFVYSKRPDLRSGAAPVGEQAEAAAPAQPEIAAPKFRGDLQASAAIPRRVPVPFLRPELTLCKASGVTLTTGSRVVVMPDQGGVGKALIKRLEKLGAEVLVIEDVPTGEELVKRLEAWKAQGEIQGVFWLAALDEEAPVENMKLADWKAATHLRVKLLYHTMRTLYGHINQPGTFLVSATRLGGRHGYDAAGAVAPLGGAVSGFTKAYKREQPEVLVKVVDFAPSRKTAQLADLLIEETLLDPGVVEVGYAEERRWTVGLAEMPAEDGRLGMTLGRETVFLITGAAGSIVSAITADLADASGGVFHLLDLAPRPDPGNPDLVRFANDKENLKKDIFQRLKDGGQRATPAMVEKELASLERQYAALSAIRAVEQAGGSAHYYSVNLLDGAAMDAVMSQVRQTSGRIDVLLHAGGLEISRLLPDKVPGEFDLVFDVKSDGWFNLLSNLGDMPLGAAVVFSSIAGRFGNGGQTDYSSANDLLCKSISAFRRNRPDTRGIALDWTAWGGIGMAARGSIPAIMKAAGIDMLPPEAGIAFIRRELSAGGTRQEVVVAQGLGMMLNEFDESGGLDLGENSELARQAGTQGIMSDRVVGMGLYSGLTIEKTLDPSEQPFLYDHQIDGTPVLPGVMGIEALSEAARLLFPDRHLAAVEEVNFLAPFKFYRNEPRTVTVQANFSLDGEDIVADCRLLGTRQLHGQAAPQVSTHFTARVRLSATAPEKAKYPLPAPMNGKSVEAEDIYRLYFHGPAYRVLERAWRSGGQVMGAFAEDLPENHRPVERITLASPRLIELCFQTAGIWEMGSKSRMGLPHGIRRVEFHGDPAAAKGRLHAAVTPNPDGSFDARVIDGKGNHFLTLAGYHTSELPDPIAEDILSPLKQIVN